MAEMTKTANFGAIPRDFYDDPRLKGSRQVRADAALILGICSPRGRFTGDEEDLARELRIETGEVAEMMRELEARGWVVFYSSPGPFGPTVTTGLIVKYNRYRGLPDNRRQESRVADTAERFPAPPSGLSNDSEWMPDRFAPWPPFIRKLYGEPTATLREPYGSRTDRSGSPTATLTLQRQRREEKEPDRAGAREQSDPVADGEERSMKDEDDRPSAGTLSGSSKATRHRAPKGMGVGRYASHHFDNFERCFGQPMNAGPPDDPEVTGKSEEQLQAERAAQVQAMFAAGAKKMEGDLLGEAKAREAATRRRIQEQLDEIARLEAQESAT